MSRYFDGVGNYLRHSAAVKTAAPLSIGIWLNPIAVTGDLCLVSIADRSANTDFFCPFLMGSVAGDPARSRINGGSWAGADSDTAVIANTWQQALFVYASSTSRWAYLNGNPGAEDTVDTTPAAGNLDTTAIGILDRASLYGTFYGYLAEVAIWNTALTTGDALQLAKGFSPLQVRPHELVAYWPLIRDINDRVGGYDMTALGESSWGSHPPIIQPSPVFYSIPSVTVVDTAATDLTAYLQTLNNETATALTAYLKTLNNETATALTAYLKTLNNETATALTAYLQTLNNETATELSGYLWQLGQAQTELTAYLSRGVFTDLTAYLSKLGVQTATALTAYLIEAEKFPHMCVKAQPREQFKVQLREQFKASVRENFTVSRDQCPSNRRPT